MFKKLAPIVSKVKSKIKLPKVVLSKKLKLFFVSSLSLVVILLTSFYYRNRLISIFYVAKVGNVYITRSEFNKELNKRYASTVLDNLSTLQIVSQELAKNNIDVTDEQVNAKITQIEASLGGSKIDEVLKAQNVEKSEFVSQIKLQIGAEELVKNSITVTDAEVADFITNNGSQLVSLAETDKNEEAKGIIRDQKIQTEIGTWLSSIKAKYPVIAF